MSKEIFRKAALERLASPEQLDRPVRVVSAISWVALWGFIATVVGAVIWGFTAKAPVKVLAQGIFIEEAGLFEIVANEQGRLQELSLRPGMEVTQGMVVATFAQTELQRELAGAEADVADARDRHEKLQAFYKEVSEREAIGEKERLETIGQIKEQVSARLTLLQKKEDGLRELVKKKVVTQDTLIDSQLNISNARERISKLEDEEKVLELDRLDRESKRRLTLLDEGLKIRELERRVERLKAQLSEKRTVTSPHSGTVVEVKVDVGDVVDPGTALATIASKGQSEASSLKAVLYVPPKDGKRVKAGMTVELNPSTVRPEKFGYMLGEVERVAPLPATVEGMKIVLKNEQLAQQLSGEGAPFEVRVRPITDAASVSGFKWSSSKGPPIAFNAGTLTEGKLIVDRVRLLGLLAPGLDRFQDGPDG